MSESNNEQWGPWIGWNGDACPVDDYAMVQAMYEDGGKPETLMARKHFWFHEQNTSLIAYRVKIDLVEECKAHKTYESFIVNSTHGLLNINEHPKRKNDVVKIVEIIRKDNGGVVSWSIMEMA